MRNRGLYLRYDAGLCRASLDPFDCTHTELENVQEPDSLNHIDELLRVGRAVADQIRPEHFGSFV